MDAGANSNECPTDVEELRERVPVGSYGTRSMESLL
jgi:hypothetical protein